MLKLRPLPRLLFTAVLACQLMVGAPVRAQPVAMAPDAAAAASQPTATHCAGHAMEQTLEQGATAIPVSSNHHAAGHDKGCCGDSGCASANCASHCAGAIALTPTFIAGAHLVPANLVSALLAEPRVARRSFGFFRPPI